MLSLRPMGGDARWRWLTAWAKLMLKSAGSHMKKLDAKEEPPFEGLASRFTVRFQGGVLSCFPSLATSATRPLAAGGRRGKRASTTAWGGLKE